jgi:phytanoyl-CoA hydroxylase
MNSVFLEPNGGAQIAAMPLTPAVKKHALDVVLKGYTVIEGGVSPELCRDTISAFRQFEQANEAIFVENRVDGHYPRIVNLHLVMRELLPLFTRNTIWLQVQDVLFGAPASLYTSLFYETGSQQPIHRDTPVFCTRPEYLYFGTTVYLEEADDDNGCLEVMEFGHTLKEPDREAMALRRFGSLDEIPPLDNNAWVEYQDAVVQQGRESGLSIKRLHVKAGDSLIWHPQLPHGGSPILDKSRTRFSLVMHNTPVGVPVYHQDVFFNPNKAYPEIAPWGYFDFEGRMIADHRHGISFAHQRNYPLDHFAWPKGDRALQNK